MELIQLLALLKSEPNAAVMLLAGAAIVVGLWLRVKKADIESMTSVTKLQSDHLRVLMEQNRQLADDLAALRERMAEQHELMQRLRVQIADLESDIRRYQSKCDTCPGPPPGGTAQTLDFS